MTPQQLLDEIQSGPLAAELAVAWGESDSTVAQILNRKDRDGYIPARHIEVSLSAFPQVAGLIHWGLRTGEMPTPMGGGEIDFGLYCLFVTLRRVIDSGRELRAEKAAIVAALEQVAPLVTAGVIPEEFGPYLLSGEQQISRAEELWGYGFEVTAGMVFSTRNL